MGCLESSVPEESPERRVRDREGALKLSHHNGSDVKSSFFFHHNKFESMN